MSVSLGISLLAHHAAAQSNARIAGRVVNKSTQSAIAGAEVLLAPGSLRVLSDSTGRFRFDDVLPGNVTVLVRRLGFVADTSYVTVQAREDLDLVVELVQSAQSLDTVNVAAPENPIPRGRLAAFYERKKFGIGRFIESNVFEQEQHRQLGDVITSRTPGVRLVRARASSAVWLATTRQAGTSTAGLDPSDRRRGADPRACYPDVYLDGNNVYAYGRGMPLFDVNLIGTNNVAAVEFYVGASQTPSQYAKVGSVCGVVLIWTK